MPYLAKALNYGLDSQTPLPKTEDSSTLLESRSSSAIFLCSSSTCHRCEKFGVYVQGAFCLAFGTFRGLGI